MFAVGDRVRVKDAGGLLGKLGTVVQLDAFPGEDYWIFVDVDGYSNTEPALFINALAGFEHYVPFQNQHLELI